MMACVWCDDDPQVSCTGCVFEKPTYVMGHESDQRVNQAMAVADMLQSSDGREFHITHWYPRMSVNNLVSVQLTALVKIRPLHLHI